METVLPPMRVSHRQLTSSDGLPRPTSRMDTILLWTEKGVIHKDSNMSFSFQTTDTPNVFDVHVRPFRGSVSHVFYTEPATITWYGPNQWREQTPTSDSLYSVLDNEGH